MHQTQLYNYGSGAPLLCIDITSPELGEVLAIAFAWAWLSTM